MKRKAWLLLSVLLCCGGGHADTQVVDTGFVTEWKSRQCVRYITLCNDRIAYRIRTDGTRFGIDRPTKSNWYGNCLFELQVNGTSVYDQATPAAAQASATDNPARIVILKQEAGGTARFSWSMPDAEIEADVVLRDGDDKLLLTIKLEQRREIRSVTLKFNNYPSSYNRNAERDDMKLCRAVATPTRTLEQGATVDLGREEPWIFYFDRHYDPARTYPLGTPEHLKGEGSSGMVYDPREWAKVKLQVTSYGVHTIFTAASGQDTFHFALWEFKGAPNNAALGYMRNLIVEPVKQQ